MVLIQKTRKLLAAVSRIVEGISDGVRAVAPDARRRWILALLLSSLVFWGLHNVWRHPKDPTEPRPKIPTVYVAAVTRADLPHQLRAIGSVAAHAAIAVKAQVIGTLLSRHFTEGDRVKKGQVLAKIDPAPFAAALQQAQGQLQRDRAILENAKIDLARYKKLWQQKAISEQQYQTQRWLVNQYQGIVSSDEGSVAQAHINLDYCTIIASDDGVIGLEAVDPGNVVTPSDATPIVTIVNTEPLSVLFSLPEQAGVDVAGRIRAQKGLKVIIFDRSDRTQLATSQECLMDNQIDPTTGTLKFRAIIRKPDCALVPNQFVHVHIQTEVIKEALVVPLAAVHHGQKGAFVYTVRDQHAVMQPVTLGLSDAQQVEVLSGIAEGERVVVDGADQVRDGQEIATRDLTSHIINETVPTQEASP